MKTEKTLSPNSQETPVAAGYAKVAFVMALVATEAALRSYIYGNIGPKRLAFRFDTYAVIADILLVSPLAVSLFARKIWSLLLIAGLVAVVLLYAREVNIVASNFQYVPKQEPAALVAAIFNALCAALVLPLLVLHLASKRRE